MPRLGLGIPGDRSLLQARPTAVRGALARRLVQGRGSGAWRCLRAATSWQEATDPGLVGRLVDATHTSLPTPPGAPAVSRLRGCGPRLPTAGRTGQGRGTYELTARTGCSGKSEVGPLAGTFGREPSECALLPDGVAGGGSSVVIGVDDFECAGACSGQFVRYLTASTMCGPCPNFTLRCSRRR